MPDLSRRTPELITRDEWLALLETAAESKPTEGSTAEEIAILWDCSIWTARKRIKGLFAQGRLARGWAASERIDGQKCRVPVYWPVEKP